MNSPPGRPRVGERLAIWSRSNGIAILAVAGAFWLVTGLALGGPAAVRGQRVAAVLVVLLGAGLVVLLGGATRLRRQAPGFHLAELQGEERRTSQRARRGLRLVSLAQAVVISMVAFLLARRREFDLIWPATALIVSLHFIPLARVLAMRAYYVTGLAATAVCLLAMAILSGHGRMLVTGTGMGVILWLTAAYLLANVPASTRTLNVEP